MNVTIRALLNAAKSNAALTAGNVIEATRAANDLSFLPLSSSKTRQSFLGALVTPENVVTAAHPDIDCVGGSMSFTTGETRLVVAKKQAGADILIYRLDTPVVLATPIPIAPTSWYDLPTANKKVAERELVFLNNQDRMLQVGQVMVKSRAGVMVSKSPEFPDLFFIGRRGDSGSAIFAMVDNRYSLVAVNKTGVSGLSLGFGVANLNAAIKALNPKSPYKV